MNEANTFARLRDVWPDSRLQRKRSNSPGRPDPARGRTRVLQKQVDAHIVAAGLSPNSPHATAGWPVSPTFVPDFSLLETRRSTMIEQLPVSEGMEAAGLKALHTAASDELRDRLGLRLERIGGAMVSIATNDPSILLNRALGLGLNEPATEEDIQRIRTAYRDHDVDRFYLGVHPDARPDGIEQLLETAGLASGRRWMKFERGPDPAPTAESSLEVREIGAEHVDEFGRIAASGFGLTPAAAPLFRGLIDRPGFHLYMTFDDETPAGTGLVYIDGEHAWVDWAATDPEFRQRGSQRALLARRIEAAVNAGCTRLMTCTGEAVPGDPQHSYHNIEWAGFEPKFLRENWVPDST